MSVHRSPSGTIRTHEDTLPHVLHLGQRGESGSSKRFPETAGPALAPDRGRSSERVRHAERFARVARGLIYMALVALLALVAAAPASADVPTDASLPYGPVVDISRGLNAARAYWGRGPDCPDGVEATLFDDPDPTILARGADCHIWVDQSMILNYLADGGEYVAEIAVCDVTVHEYGHLLGYVHSDVPTVDDPLDVMRERGPVAVPACEAPPASSETNTRSAARAPDPAHRGHHRKHRHRKHRHHVAHSRRARSG